MKNYWIAVVVAGAMGVAGAQTGASTSTNNNTSVSAGQTGANASQSTQANANAPTLRAELTKSLDAKKAKAGDEVTARVSEDAKAGAQVIRKGSKLVGHVTEAQARSKENAESKLGIVFDKAVLKDGAQVNLNAIVVALAPEPRAPMPSMPDDNSRMGGGGSAPMGGGPIGGVAPSASGVGSTISGVSGNVTSAAGAATGNAGGLAGGTLTTTARGVIWMEGVTLGTSASGSANTQASVLSSTSHNIKLDSGTQMVLQVNGSIQP